MIFLVVSAAKTRNLDSSTSSPATWGRSVDFHLKISIFLGEIICKVFFFFFVFSLFLIWLKWWSREHRVEQDQDSYWWGRCALWYPRESSSRWYWSLKRFVDCSVLICLDIEEITILGTMQILARSRSYLISLLCWSWMEGWGRRWAALVQSKMVQEINC